MLFRSVDMGREETCIRICIRDNGCGMPEEMVQEINAGVFRSTDDKNHIGMENAITRLYMYYGEKADVQIDSRPGEGTAVLIRIPVTEDGGNV